MATDHILIQSSIASQFLETLKGRLSAMASGSQPLPHVVTLSSKTRLEKPIADTVEKGADVFFGSNGKNSPPGIAFAPTTLSGVKKSAKLWNDEAFGPLAAYSLFETQEEAVEMANDQPYGLSAAVFTRGLRKGFRVAKLLESGYGDYSGGFLQLLTMHSAVHINGMTDHDEPSLPFGGVKNSGWGRFNADYGMEEFLVTKRVTWDE